jgi:hypothetical protein
MAMFRPLFGAGTARGGTGLVVQTLRVHSRVELAMEPFLSVFKHYRVALHEAISRQQPHRVPLLVEPISSLYYDEESPPYLYRILDRTEDALVSASVLTEIRNGIRGRAVYDAADLVPYVDEVKGQTYSAVIDSALAMVQRARKRSELEWCGFLENWCVEFFPFLADHFPSAKFFLVVRDPRAVMSSALHAPLELRSTLFSYLRSIRKMFDLSLHFAGDPRFKGRLCIVKFEALVANPERISQEVCDFLEIDYEPWMIRSEHHLVPGSIHLRDGVSSFESNAVGYDTKRATRWKDILEPEIVECLNACMSRELEIFGYLETVAPPLSADLIQRVLSNPRISEIVPKWSIDMSTLAGDYGAEVIRAQLIEAPPSNNGHLVGRLMRECFLTDRIAKALVDFGSAKTHSPDFRSFDHLIRI